ncbi:MFS family permease [Paenarthrobacter nicotinovorans]|uniref:MFS transporter n=1 Tax=Micrococcaceae TaxID=1268 RepID=UPI00087605A5|nr:MULTISPECIES: MFS transporter [Micrococcaceae]MDR6437242.1 MFS family permease [Paenarthrobacter nicotinovorans]SCZ53985.1 Major Facilitator Superfamily protein [Arthrobacter sp. UNCCL28]
MKVGLRGQLGLFTVLFAGGMWMSKIAQPLYFEQLGALVAFGIGYAVMAVVGGFSFAWGAFADRFGGLNSVRLGTLIYGIGIAGRLFTDVVPVVVFSAIAGAGASLVLVAIRPWVRATATDDEIPKIVGARNLGNQTGILLGTVGAGSVFALAATQVDGARTALLTAPALIAAAFVWVLISPQPPARPRVEAKPQQADPTLDRRRYTAVAAKLAAIGVLSGFYVSLVAPYLPLILTNGGATAAQAALIMAVMSLAQIGATWLFSRHSKATKPFGLFTVAEVFTGLITTAAALALGFGVLWIAIIFIVRAAFVSLAVAAEETIQYAVIPAKATGFIFGISQTAFLVGDALGGVMGAPLWMGIGPEGLLVTAGVITLVNSGLLPLLLRGVRTEPMVKVA